MFDWDQVEIWTKRTLARNHYRFRHWLIEDLLQEARIVHWRSTERYTDAEVLERAAQSGSVKNPERVIARSRMAYYQRALMNRLNSIAALVETRVAQASGSVDEDVYDWLLARAGRPKSHAIGQWELAHDLQRCHLVRTVLESASWDDGRHVSRSPRTRKDGTMESTNDVLCRLGKLQAGQPVAAELADLVGPF